MRVLAALAVIWLALAPAKAEETLRENDVTLEIEVEETSHTPFAEEMVMLTIRGAYRLPITLEKLHQPELEGLGWMQLGEDRWFRTDVRGKSVLNLERRMALFPERAGRIEIPPFTHELQLLSRNGRRFSHSARSNAVHLDVASPPEAEGWWFPLRHIEISDNWSNPPERLAAGQGVLRVVVVEAHGTQPERLPPMPDLTGAGAHIFPHPERRIVTLGPDGPITRAFWRWTVRPMEDSAGYLNPMKVHYFDARVRKHREISLSAQRVAYADGPQAVTESAKHASAGNGGEGGMALRLPAVPMPPLWSLVLAGLGVGLAAMLGSRSAGRIDWSALRRLQIGLASDRVRLGRAARAGDGAGLWRVARRMLAGRPAPPELRALERVLFAPGQRDMPELGTVARAVRSAAG